MIPRGVLVFGCLLHPARAFPTIDGDAFRAPVRGVHFSPRPMCTRGISRVCGHDAGKRRHEPIQPHLFPSATLPRAQIALFRPSNARISVPRPLFENLSSDGSTVCQPALLLRMYGWRTLSFSECSNGACRATLNVLLARAKREIGAIKARSSFWSDVMRASGQSRAERRGVGKPGAIE